MAASRSVARLNVRLPADLKRTIEAAAARTGQSLSDFAVSSLAQSARQVLREQQTTELSERDRQRFAALLDDETAKPNAALRKAAKRSQKLVG